MGVEGFAGDRQERTYNGTATVIQHSCSYKRPGTENVTCTRRKWNERISLLYPFARIGIQMEPLADCQKLEGEK